MEERAPLRAVKASWSRTAVPFATMVALSNDPSELFTGLAPVLNVRDVVAERAFYESLGLPVIYEGDEYPDFIAFGNDKVHFGIQPAPKENDPPSVLTWQFVVADIDAAIRVCTQAGLEFEVEQNNPAPGWSYRRLLLQTPSGYRLALEEDQPPPS
jgi:predicted enzyme related to lactoylglutathione lyase